jgi:trimethylamine--corrinoid protein Co-methyltransferase
LTATPPLALIQPETVDLILSEAFELLKNTGIRVGSDEALELLSDSGAIVDPERRIVRIPDLLVQKSLESTPKIFWLHDSHGQPCVCYGESNVHFDPGSSGVHILDSDTGEHRVALTEDLLTLVRIAEVLPQYDAQSTAVVCQDVPEAIGDFYRLFLVLLSSKKPIVTGAFSSKTLHTMFEMLAIASGDRQKLEEKPRAIFDVCPSPPLNWTEFASQNLIDLSRARIPAQIVSMPLVGATAPVTLLGSIVQHTAECLSGITIHQLATPGSPIVWGGAPAIFDMRTGTTPSGAIETAMLVIGYAQIGRSLGLPTHAYLGGSDSKSLDPQSGAESSIGILLGALAGVNMISGAGMLDFLACLSPEKLILDADWIGMARRLLEGFQVRTSPLALDMFIDPEFRFDFLKQKLTRQLFPLEQYLTSNAIDRNSLRVWEITEHSSAMDRARALKHELLRRYCRPHISPDIEKHLIDLVSQNAKNAGMDNLPWVPIN